MNTTTTPRNITYQANTTKGAWALMRAFERAGIPAGYPSLKPANGYYTVAVSRKNLDAADRVYCTAANW